MRQEQEREQVQEQKQQQFKVQPSRYEYGQEQQKHRIFAVTEGVAPQTGVFYQRALNHFQDFIKIHDEQVLLDFSPKVIKQMIVDYILYLRDEKPGKKLGRNSIKGQLSAILHFFQINNDDFTLTSKNFRVYLPSDDTVQDDRPYSKDEIAQILKDCDKRSKAVIYLMCSAGLRIGAIHPMQIGDLIETNYNGLPLYKVRVYARTRSEYYSYATPEGYTAIKDYLDSRARKEILKDTSPLIREQYNKDNPFTINSPRFVTQKAIEWLLENCLQKSGVRKPKVVHLSHGMRKYFVSTCESSFMKTLHVSMISGHTTGIKKRYYMPNDAVVLEDYMTHAADALTISSEYRLKKRNQELETEQAQELERIKSQLAEKEQQLRRTVEALEIKSMNSIDKIEKQIVKLNDMIVGEVTTDNDHGGIHYYKYKKA